MSEIATNIIKFSIVTSFIIHRESYIIVVLKDIRQTKKISVTERVSE